jgi:hypothetical protein
LSIPTIHTLEPAFAIIERLGGKASVAESLNLDKSTLSRWCQPKPNGTGGLIPQRYWSALVVMARQQGVDITLEELAAVEV